MTNILYYIFLFPKPKIFVFVQTDFFYSHLIIVVKQQKKF